MGVDLAVQSVPPNPRGAPSDETRAARLRAVAEVVRLYEALERALEVTGDSELAQLVTASRAGERALGRWAIRLEALRSLKRRVELGILEPARRICVLHAATPVDLPLRPRWTLPEPRALPFAWEAAAFLVGLAVSLVCT